MILKKTMQIRVLKNGKPIFSSIGNTKQEAEIDLLYQIVLESPDLSLQIIDNPTIPTNNPTNDLFQKFVESLNLEDEEDYFLHERLMQFKNKENKEQS